jgi:hypothetical protein
MAKLNEGDVIEGIFTIALSLYLAYKKIDKNKLNTIRTKVDTKMFSTGRFKYIVAENLKRQGKNKKKPVDFFNVAFEMRLKPESVSGAFDKDFQILYEKSKDIGKIDRKIDQLISTFESSNYIRKVNKVIDNFLDNNYGEVVTFTVISDGIAGESSGGEIKGDVTLQIYAERKKQGKKIFSDSIPFSLKSESVTVANLSPYNGMLDFADSLNIKWNAKEKYARLSKAFTGPKEQKAKFKLIKRMYNELQTKIIEKSKQDKTNFNKSAFSFLKKSIFGSDLADVVDVQSKTVKEITVEYFDTLQKNTNLIVEKKGNNLVFLDENNNFPIFQIRTKLRRPPANEAKFYLEVGKGIYAK